MVAGQAADEKENRTFPRRTHGDPWPGPHFSRRLESTVHRALGGQFAEPHRWAPPVTNANGESACARVTTGQGNVLTAQAGVEIARRVIAGEAKPGFQTPSLVFGSDFILQFGGAKREVSMRDAVGML